MESYFWLTDIQHLKVPSKLGQISPNISNLDLPFFKAKTMPVDQLYICRDNQLIT